MQDKVEILLTAVRSAGQSVLELQKDIAVTTKANNDVVTQADLSANDILYTSLHTHFPEIAWLSEESVDDTARLHARAVWIVDPIDGTREYAAGIPEYALSIALIEDGIPVLAVVYNPATNELFHAIKNQGAWLNNNKMTCSVSSDPILLASRSEYRRGEWERFQNHYQIKATGSIAYKLALVAAGKGAATFSLGPKNEWDIAAGVLLVREAGGIVTNKQGELLQFNQKNVKINGIVACAAEIKHKIFTLIHTNESSHDNTFQTETLNAAHVIEHKSGNFSDS